MTAPGPVSAALEADLRDQARQHGILVRLDKEGRLYRICRSAARARRATTDAVDPTRSVQRSVPGDHAGSLAGGLAVGAIEGAGSTEG